MRLIVYNNNEQDIKGGANMTIGDRISKRRKELGMSADDVAEKLGKNRATIYRYESAEIENLPITIIMPLSKILRVSPAYLMGWEEDHEYDNSIPVPVYGTIP